MKYRFCNAGLLVLSWHEGAPEGVWKTGQTEINTTNVLHYNPFDLILHHWATMNEEGSKKRVSFGEGPIEVARESLGAATNAVLSYIPGTAGERNIIGLSD
jgi:hypothetical protein